MSRAARVKWTGLLAIVLAGLLLRLALLSLVSNPGLHDPQHYFNLGRRLAQGHGFTIDYVWHYSRMPVELVHATDHWMPLPGVAAALGMALGGVNIQSALAVFVLAGTLLPLLSFWACRVMRLPDKCSLIAAALTALNPELVFNSLRTDSVVLNALFICGGMLLLSRGFAQADRRLCACSGIAFGLAYLTRNESILFAPMLIALAMIYTRLRRGHRAWRGVWMTLGAALLTASPWLLRNLHETGALSSPLTARMPFMVDPADLHAWRVDITLETLLARQSIGELLGKRLFELAASFKQMALALELPSALLAPVGTLLILRRLEGRLLLMTPALIWTALMLLAYPLLMPVVNQSGSFHRAFITILPLLTPLAAFALLELCQRRAWLYGIVALSILWLGGRSIEIAANRTAHADAFFASIGVLVDALEDLPDHTGDGETRLMVQEPYAFSSVGIKSIVAPLASRQDVLELADMYDIDYLMLPAARPALDPLYLGAEVDPRFQLALHLPEAGEQEIWQLYSMSRPP